MTAKYSIGGFPIGGRLGESPTWLVGSIFYMGDKLLEGGGRSFNRAEARKKLEEALSIAAETGIVLALDVVLPTREIVESALAFLGEFKVPLFIDSPDPGIRSAGYLAASNLGLRELAIANGIYLDSPREELEAIRESGISAAVLMAFDPRNPYESIDPRSRAGIVERLVSMAHEARVGKLLVDTVVIDPSSIYLSGESIRLLKERFDFPAGAAPANALGSVTKEAVGAEAMAGIHGGAAVFLRMMGADFVMYGPLGRIKYVAPAVAFVDSLLGYGLRRAGMGVEARHPTRIFLRKIQQLFVGSGR